MLAFAKDAMFVQKEIVRQHGKYWQLNIENAKHKADKLTEHDPKLRIEMYELLGQQGKHMPSSLRLYAQAADISAETLGENNAKTLILEVKSVVWHNVLPHDDRIEEAQKILSRWSGGTPLEYAELLRNVARAELASKNKTIRQQGMQHSLEAQKLEEEHATSNRSLISLITRRIWSWTFLDKDVASLSKAIDLAREVQIPMLEKEYFPESFHVLAAKIILGAALVSRAEQEVGEQKPKDVELALKINEGFVEELVGRSGYEYNTVWQVMNNLAINLVEKAKLLEQDGDGNEDEIKRLRQRAGTLWQRCLQQSYFRKGSCKWYLGAFQGYLPDMAPTDEEWAAWKESIDQMPENQSYVPLETKLSAE